MKTFNSPIENNLHFLLDRNPELYIHEHSLQTLHRMPSEQWGYRPVFPTVFFYPKIRGLTLQQGVSYVA